MVRNEEIAIHPKLTIPESELRFATSRSSGPGGQNVNKVESRVTLLFDIAASPTLSADEKRRIRYRLPTRINKQGVLRVVAQKHRTQAANRQEATSRFAELLAEALKEAVPRKATVVPTRVQRRRLDDKRRQSQLKKKRQSPLEWED